MGVIWKSGENIIIGFTMRCIARSVEAQILQTGRKVSIIGLHFGESFSFMSGVFCLAVFVAKGQCVSVIDVVMNSRFINTNDV
jgi:hypothetical protein